MGLGTRVFFGKVPSVSPFVCAGILRKEVDEKAVAGVASIHGLKQEREKSYG